jgi:hypothetical protein
MNNQLILLPVLVQIVLTIALYLSLIALKIRAVKAGEVDAERRALHDDAWPDYVQQVNNCIRNQFEVPVLFYVFSISMLVIGAVNLTALVLAWIFVTSRVAHAFVHTGSNYVPTRRRLFIFGVGTVSLMSLLLGWALI